MLNFDNVAAGNLSAQHHGQPWYDGLIYEMIRAGGDFLAAKPEPALEARIDGCIDRICAAAAIDPDGYINTYTQMREPTHRWGQNGGNDRWQHDLYNAGALVDAGVHYYRATGKTKLLETSIRMANLMCKVMGPPPRQNIIPGHAMAEESMLGLYQLFKEHPELKAKLNVPVNEASYLSLAQFWIDARGHHEGRTDFGAYDQDDVPVMQQKGIEGHAVRAALMWSAVTALGSATGRTDYANAAERIWENMTEKRMYITGGVGAFASDEKFGPDYVLPNDAYAETCAAVANGFFDHNINLATGKGAAVDELERTLYNGALAGVSLAGNSYFYENPLRAAHDRLRWFWHACPCCPPMFLKMMSALPGYIYAIDSHDGVYVNLFIGSKATIKLASGTVNVTQTTHYPWDGDVKIAIDPTQATNFDLFLRIPGWTRGGSSNGGLYMTAPEKGNAYSVTVNDAPIESVQANNGYFRLHREWKSGDVVTIHMAMPIQRVHADARVEADRDHIALMRGPIVYCLESIDNAGSIQDIVLPESAAITEEYHQDILGGTTLLHAKAMRTHAANQTIPTEITAIPYYANANRGPVSMTVWINDATP